MKSSLIINLVLVSFLASVCTASSCCSSCPCGEEEPETQPAETVNEGQRGATTLAVANQADAPTKKAVATGGCGMPTAFFAWSPGHKMEVLFSFWTIDSIASYVISCIAIFMLGFLFEGFQTLQQLADERLKRSNAANNLKLGETCCKKIKFSKCQEALRASLHACRVFLSLMLMLIFMLFEWGTAMSLVAGAGLGFFVFHVWSPLSDSSSAPRQAGCH